MEIRSSRSLNIRPPSHPSFKRLPLRSGLILARWQHRKRDSCGFTAGAAQAKRAMLEKSIQNLTTFDDKKSVIMIL
jgi:hypothetical protein